MDNEPLFTETQKFKQWWLWLILIAVNCVCIVSLAVQLADDEPSDESAGTIALSILTAIALLFTILFAKSRLETLIRNDGIYVRFYPFHLKYKHYSWNSITKSYVREYAPLLEYGGWGLRFGISSKGTAYNVSGNKGLQLEFQNRKKLLIGTIKPDELAETLQRIGQLKS